MRLMRIYQKKTREQYKYEVERRKVKKNIEYEHMYLLSNADQRERIDELSNLIVDAVCSKGATIRACGEDIPIDVVKERFLQLRREDLEYVMECMERNTTQIKNIKSYLLTALYNAPITKGHSIRHQ